LSVGLEVDGMVVCPVRRELVRVFFREDVQVRVIPGRDDCFKRRRVVDRRDGDVLADRRDAQEIAVVLRLGEQSVEHLLVDKGDERLGGSRVVELRLGTGLEDDRRRCLGRERDQGCDRLSEEQGVLSVIDDGIVAPVPGNAEDDVD
jgi:hypothetical protein